MRLNLKLFALLTISVLVYSNAMSQSKPYPYPLPLVVYNDNVNAPLTASELTKIKEVYGDLTESMILSKPRKLKNIKNILRNRVLYQQPSAGETFKECPMLSSVALFDNYVPNMTRDIIFDKDTFNPLKYGFSFNSTGSYIYKVDNTNYYIIIKSQHQ